MRNYSIRIIFTYTATLFFLFENKSTLLEISFDYTVANYLSAKYDKFILQKHDIGASSVIDCRLLLAAT